MGVGKNQTPKQLTFRKKCKKGSVTPKTSRTPIKEFENVIEGEKLELREGGRLKSSRR